MTNRLEHPLGAIVNGKTLLDRVEGANYENEEQFLNGSDELRNFHQCFATLCDYADYAKKAIEELHEALGDCLYELPSASGLEEQYRQRKWRETFRKYSEVLS